MAFGKRRAEDAAVDRDAAAGESMDSDGARMGLLLSTLLCLAGFITVLGGLAALQEQVNDLAPEVLVSPIYIEGLQSANEVPYANPHRAWGLFWWLCWFELVMSLVLLLLACTAGPLLRFKHTAMAFIVYLWVLATLQIDGLLFLNRSAIMSSVLNSSRVEAALAGLYIGAVANGLQLLCLGLLRDPATAAARTAAMRREGSFGGGKRVAADAAAAPGAGGPGMGVHEKPVMPAGQQTAGMV